MILVTRFNRTTFFVNADLIQTVEATPDTVITLVNNERLVVKESPEVIVERVVAYKRQVYCNQIISKEYPAWI